MTALVPIVGLLVGSAASAQLPPPPAPPPVWESAPVTPDARTVAEQIVTVKPGEGLLAIAARTGASAATIARANALPPSNALRIGQRLKIPAGRYHLVRQGQSGIAIARAYGVDWSRVVAVNAIVEPYVLRAGTRLLIPASQAKTGQSRAAERAAAFRLDIDDIVTGGQPALARNARPVRPIARPAQPLAPAVVVAPPPRLSGGGFVWPVTGKVVKRFGPGPTGDRSDGIKIAVPLATPIKAAGDGVVAYAGSGIAALGGLIIMRHGSGWTSVYGHAARLLVTRGQSVKRGQTIALSGDTGFADRPELHFELRKNRLPVDPVGLLRRE